MSDTLSGLARRVRLTPVRDLIRGRITGQDWKAAVQRSGLPVEITSLVMVVVRKTRLWLSEKLDVANELIAHFADGLEAGRSPEELITSFGDVRRAAKLIRRAKRRARSLQWKAVTLTIRSVECVVLLYVIAAIYLCMGKPAPTVDYTAMLNQRVSHIPESDRGWPLYRRAILATMVRTPRGDHDYPQVVGYNPYGKHWPEMKAWVGSNAGAIDLIRQGAAKPAIGIVLGKGGTGDDPELGWNWFHHPLDWQPDEMTDALMSAPLPHLNDVRTFAEILSLDAKLALEQKDAVRWERDVVATLDLARQENHESRFVLNALVSVAIRGVALNEIDAAMAEHAELLDEALLERLAHRLSGARAVADVMDFSSERYFVLDFFQRVYTSGGRGRLTWEGWKAMRPMMEHEDTWALASPFAVPLLQFVVAPRGQVEAEHNRYMDKLEARALEPLRDTGTSAISDEKSRINRNAWVQARYIVWNVMLPTFDAMLATGERSLGHSDGLMVGIALETYKRRHGAYPATLGALTPDLLPSVPVDRIAGGPLKYKIANGKPLVYSVGVDRQDDGGRTPKYPLSAAMWNPDAAGVPSYQGDWVVYPWARDTSAEDPE